MITVDQLDVNKYVGLWYQTYANIYSVATFEKDGYCITALYGTETNVGDISVHNYQTIGSPTGPPDIIDGDSTTSNLYHIFYLVLEFGLITYYNKPTALFTKNKQQRRRWLSKR
jgi:lipocalin